MSNSTAQELLELKEEVEEAKQRQSKAEGALEQVMKQIQDEFDCEDLEEAENHSKTLRQKAKKAKIKFDEALAKFKKKWESRLDDED